MSLFILAFNNLAAVFKIKSLMKRFLFFQLAYNLLDISLQGQSMLLLQRAGQKRKEARKYLRLLVKRRLIIRQII